MKTKAFLSVIFSIALFFLIITFSIALPIFCRYFYYAHIGPLSLSEASGFTAEEIKDSYNLVLDYLTLPNKEFSTGVMAYSAEGKAHFADCKALFTLNTTVLLASTLLIIILLSFKKIKGYKAFTLGKHSAAFYSALAAVILPVGVGILASADFNKAFTVFHTLFFPGKTNWIFNPYTDEIINVLPQQFFMNCAILIGASILTLSLSILLSEKKRMHKEK